MGRGLSAEDWMSGPERGAPPGFANTQAGAFKFLHGANPRVLGFVRSGPVHNIDIILTRPGPSPGSPKDFHEAPMIEFFYDPQGGALCQNEKGLTFFLQGLPPARPQGRAPEPARTVPPAALRPEAGRPGPGWPARSAGSRGLPR